MTGIVVEAPALHRACETLVGNAGQRYTSQRRAVVAALASFGRPVTVPELISSERPALSLSSTYRNLAVLCEAGVAQRVGTLGEHARYELSEQVLGRHHHHARCTDCGTVVDLPDAPKLERALSVEFDRVRSAIGFEVTDHLVDLVGRCRDCAN